MVKIELKEPKVMITPRASSVLALKPRHCILYPDLRLTVGLKMNEHTGPTIKLVF